MFCTIPRECSSKRQIQERKTQEAEVQELLFDESCICASLVGSSCALSQGVRVPPLVGPGAGTQRCPAGVWGETRGSGSCQGLGPQRVAHLCLSALVWEMHPAVLSAVGYSQGTVWVRAFRLFSVVTVTRW